MKKPPQTPKAFVLAAATHRRKLEKVMTVNASTKLKKLYDEAQGHLVSRLAKTIRAGRKDTFTAHQQRVVLAQLKQGQAVIAKRLAGEMGPLSREAQEASLNGLKKDVAVLSKHFTGSEVTLPIEEASVFAGVIDDRATSMLRMHESSMLNYGRRIVTTVEKDLALTLLTGQSPSEAIDTIARRIGGEWWQGERIVRTETAYAFSATTADGIAASAKEIPDLMQRWEENCSDFGAPLDDRVAVDSIAMHGQVATAGGWFTMPPSAPFPDDKGKVEVPFSLIGMSWQYPPNRPQDRSVLMPWMKDWGVPGWLYVGGQRHWLNR